MMVDAQANKSLLLFRWVKKLIFTHKTKWYDMRYTLFISGIYIVRILFLQQLKLSSRELRDSGQAVVHKTLLMYVNTRTSVYGVYYLSSVSGGVNVYIWSIHVYECLHFVMSILIQGERQSYPLSDDPAHCMKCRKMSSLQIDCLCWTNKKKTLLNLSSTVMSLCLPWQTLSHWNKEKAVSAVFLIGIKKKLMPHTTCILYTHKHTHVAIERHNLSARDT